LGVRAGIALACAMAPSDEQSFGARLRRERERRQIALASISANTKISVSLFEALEREDVSRWPLGIYRRSFIRAYAQGVGLDADAVMKEFLERFPDPAELAPSDPVEPAAPALKPGVVDPVVRVTLPPPGHRFAGGPLLTGIGRRLAAAACDAGIVIAIAGVMFVVFGKFWAPLGATMLAYYAGGILLLGNAPGVCLLAPKAALPKQRGDAGGGLAVKPGQILAQLTGRAKRGAIEWWGAATRV
jgi:transcriptional regulator with XRE-family HTH domain